MLLSNRKLILALVALILFGVQAAHAFERRLGARPMGMGDAFVAMADDVNAMNYNPAGIALIRGMAGSLEYANLYPGLDDGGLIQENHIAYAQNVGDIGGMGLAWNNRSLFGVYHENEIVAGYGRQIPEVPLWLGLNAKLFYLDYTDPQSLTANDYFKNASETFQFGLDVGLLYQVVPESASQPRVQTGLLLSNVNEPDLGLSAGIRQPFETRLGVSVFYQDWDADVDLTYADSDWQLHAGTEKWWLQKQWGARVGIISGEGTGLTWTLGGSYTFDMNNAKIRINYAFNYSFYGIQDTGGIHRISLDLLSGDGNNVPKELGIAKPSEEEKEEKVKRIRAYLTEQIKLYFVLSDQLALITEPEKQEMKKAGEDALHAAVGKLLLEQDILGFLGKLREAELHIKIPEKNPALQVPVQ